MSFPHTSAEKPVYKRAVCICRRERPKQTRNALPPTNGWKSALPYNLCLRQLEEPSGDMGRCEHTQPEATNNGTSMPWASWPDQVIMKAKGGDERRWRRFTGSTPPPAGANSSQPSEVNADALVQHKRLAIQDQIHRPTQITAGRP